MSKEFIITSTRHETRVAILEDDQVVEVYHQRENEYSLAGSIHKGRVTRVLPGMQSAFVDIGLDRDAFLYVSDFFEDNEEYDKIVTSVEEKVLKLERGPLPPAMAAPEPAADGPVESQPAEVVEPEEMPLGPTEPLAAETPAAAPVAAAPAAPPEQTQRREERGDWDRDRRGRRSRRRRGQKGGGRGLPDSKYFSPGPGGGPGTNAGGAPTFTPRPNSEEPRSEMRVEPAVSRVGPATPATPVTPATEPASQADDLFVLPGESLAKYADAPADWEEPAAEAGEEPVTEVEDEPLAEEAAAEAAAEPPAESQPVAWFEVAQIEVMASTPPVVPQPEISAVDQVIAAPVEAEAIARPNEVAVPAQTAEEETVDEETAAEETAAEAEGMVAGAAAETEEAPEGEAPLDVEAPPEGEALVEPDGPEPARIPTSLTATLREQGPRFLHRVSRRMRRRGGRDRDNREGREVRGRGPLPTAEPEGGRPPLAETRGVERTVSAPRPVGDTKPERSAGPSISDLLREGQEIIVQIAKEPLGQKGARITSHIALPGRFLVYMPTVDHIGVSRKIPSDDERMRLKRVLQNNRAGISGGFIVRTAGEGRSEEELRADMMFLYNMWLDMRQKAERRPAPTLIHHDLNVVERVLRDQLTPVFKTVWVDTEEAYEAVLQFVERFQPALVSRVKLYTRATPIFDEFGITAELEKALRPKVWLKSGGHIVINQTEALVAIDVNTGKYVGKSNRLEDTIVKTNTDAIKEIVRQIRLRDLGGIVVVDFIDMDERKNRQKVMQALEEAMRADRAPYKILQFNDFGLVAITRKRVKQSLERTLCTPCPYCEGAGYVKSPLTMVGEILQEAQKLAKVIEGKDVMLRVSPEVAKLLKSNQNSYLQEIEEVLGRPVFVKSDNQLHQEKFDLA